MNSLPTEPEVFVTARESDDPTRRALEEQNSMQFQGYFTHHGAGSPFQPEQKDWTPTKTDWDAVADTSRPPKN